MVYLKHTVGGKVTWSQGSLSSQDVQAVAGLASWTVINPLLRAVVTQSTKEWDACGLGQCGQGCGKKDGKKGGARMRGGKNKKVNCNTSVIIKTSANQLPSDGCLCL